MTKLLENDKAKTVIGRPTKLTPEIAKQVTEIMSKGKSQNVAIRELGISRDTFYRWKREDKEFATAIADGKVYGESVHEEIIEAIAQGRVKGASVAAYQMLMRNVYGWDKNTENTVNQTINVGQMNVLQQKSTEDLIAYIKDVQDEVGKILDMDEDVEEAEVE